MDLQAVNMNVFRVTFFRFLNFDILEVGKFHAKAEMAFDSRHIGNPIMEHYHGGIIASFMEAAAAIAVQPDFADVPAKPINLTVDYLRPGVKGPLTAQATVTRKGSRIASVRVLSWQASPEKSVAEGLYHFLLV